MADREDGRHASGEPDEFGTQPLPMVRPEGVADDQPVRAVAKRNPSALPAIGRDEPSDAPPSARATVDRRRRDREAADGAAADLDPVHEPEPTGWPLPRQRESNEDGPRPGRPPLATGTPAAVDVELVPIGSRSRPTVAAQPTASAQPPSTPEQGDAPSAGRHSVAGHETPDASGGEASPPPPPPPPAPPAPPAMGQPPDEPRPGPAIEIVEAEIIDDRARPFVVDVQTDEWATVPAPAPAAPPPGPAAPPPGGQRPMGPPPRPRGPAPQGPPPGVQGPPAPAPQGPPAPRGPSAPQGPPPAPRLGPPPLPRTGPPPRPGAHAAPAAGPGVLVSDSWAATEPLPPVDDDYQGRRRRVGGRPGRAGWLVVLGVVLLLSAAVAVPFLISENGGRESGTLPTDGQPLSTGPLQTAGLGPSGLPVIMAPSATPTLAPSAATTTAGQTTTSPPLQPPGVPGAPNTSGATSSSLSLSWSAASGTVTEYRVESCQGGSCSNFSQFGTTNVTSITVGSLASGTTYRFRVRAANSAGTSGYSDVGNGTTTAFSLTLQGEAGTPSGCAAVRTVAGASNGQVMDRIGDNDDWTGCGATDGVVTFTNVNIPAGTYTITIYYVFNEQNGDSQRYARLRLTAGGTTIDFAHTYARTTTVQSWTTSSFTRNAAAAFTITYSNPGVQGQDRSPALDRIVIQQTS